MCLIVDSSSQAARGDRTAESWSSPKNDRRHGLLACDTLLPRDAIQSSWSLREGSRDRQDILTTHHETSRRRSLPRVMIVGPRNCTLFRSTIALPRSRCYKPASSRSTRSFGSSNAKNRYRPSGRPQTFTAIMAPKQATLGYVKTQQTLGYDCLDLLFLDRGTRS